MKVRLIDICQPKQWQTISTEKLLSSGYSVYGANGIIGYYDKYNHKNPTLMITCRGATCGTINISEPFSYINGNAMSLDNLSNDVLLNYLYYQLLNYDFKDIISGSAQPQITREGLSKVWINIHCMPEQRRIVKILDKVSVLIEKCKQQLEKLDLLVKSQFIEMFGGIHDSKLYQYLPLECFATVTSGGTPDRSISEYWDNGTIRWVKTTELQNRIIYDTEEKITEKGMSNSSAKIIPTNSILIAMYGQGKTRGMTGYLANECTTNQACACILPARGVNQVYLWHFFILSYDKLRGMAKGGNQPNLNAGIIKNFPILLPPLELQNQFARFVEQTDKSKVAIKKSLEKLETLKKALMQKYFG